MNLTRQCGALALTALLLTATTACAAQAQPPLYEPEYLPDPAYEPEYQPEYGYEPVYPEPEYAEPEPPTDPCAYPGDPLCPDTPIVVPGPNLDPW